MPKGRTEQEVVSRFLSKVKVVENGCHEWQSTLHRDGYGKFWFKGKQIQSHRMSYKLFVGDVEEKWVLHTCDNRKCVNPKHLFLGTSLDNVKDMDKKNRRGTKCKLTEEQVTQIKYFLMCGISQQTIANNYSVGQTVISRIKLGKTKLFRL